MGGKEKRIMFLCADCEAASKSICKRVLRNFQASNQIERLLYLRDQRITDTDCS
jgi:hypothetical protein